MHKNKKANISMQKRRRPEKFHTRNFRIKNQTGKSRFSLVNMNVNLETFSR